jgi:hypothetical protein
VISTVEFMGLQEAEQLQPDSHTALISITRHGERARIKDGFGAVLRVAFDDMHPITESQAQETTAFIRCLELAKPIERLAVRCEHGPSCSVTVAVYAATITGATLTRRHMAVAFDRQLLNKLLRAEKDGRIRPWLYARDVSSAPMA